MGFECGRRNSSQSDQTGNYCLLPLQNTDDCGRTLRCHVITVLYGHFCRKLWYAGWGRLLWEETLCGWCLRRESETVWEPPTWLLLEESIELDGHPCMHRLLHGRGMWTGWPGPYNTRACRSIFSPLQRFKGPRLVAERRAAHDFWSQVLRRRKPPKTWCRLTMGGLLLGSPAVSKRLCSGTSVSKRLCSRPWVTLGSLWGELWATLGGLLGQSGFTCGSLCAHFAVARLC